MPGLDEQARVSAFGGRWPGKEALVRRTPTLAERETFRDQLQTQYEGRVRNLGKSVAEGRISVRQWQGDMDRATTQYLIRQQVLGAGTTRIDATAFLALDKEIRRQQAYIARFGDHVSIRALMGNPMSSASIESRATLYSGAGRALGTRAQEQNTPDEPGWVWEYVAVDDKRTCSPCLASEGFYLADEGPMPGDVCLGRGHCRCRRERVYRPEFAAPQVRRIA